MTLLHFVVGVIDRCTTKTYNFIFFYNQRFPKRYLKKEVPMAIKQVSFKVQYTHKNQSDVNLDIWI